MKQLLINISILLLCCTSIALGQGKYDKAATNIKQNRFMVDSVLGVPRDTAATNNPLYQGNPVGDSGRIAYIGGKFWGYRNLGGVLSWFQLGSDASVAPGSNDYIRNGTVPQNADYNITGSGILQYLIAKRNGSVSYQPGISLLNADGNRGANFQLGVDNGVNLYVSDNTGLFTPRFGIAPNGNTYVDGRLQLNTVNSGTRSDSILTWDASTKSVRYTKRIIDSLEIDIRWFGATNNGIDDDGPAIQAAVNAGPNVVVPEGTFGTTQTITLKGYTHIRGAGWTARIQTGLDIPIFDTDTIPGSFNQDIVLENLQLTNTKAPVGGAGPSKFHVVITDGLMCDIRHCWFRTALGPTDYNINNRGGIAFVKSGVGITSFVNWIDECVFDGSAIIMNTGDSKISRSYIWAHPMGVPGIQIVGNVRVENCDIIPNPSHGGIALTNLSNNSSIIDCYFDGSQSPVQTGTGIVANSAKNITITGNSFWNISTGGISLVNSESITITANSFQNNNRADAGNNDITVTGASRYITATGNVFTQTGSRAITGRAILEQVNGSDRPYFNNYSNNSISGSTGYTSPSLAYVSDSTHVFGNTGFGIVSKAVSTSFYQGTGVGQLQLRAGPASGARADFVNAGATSDRLQLNLYNSANTKTIQFDANATGINYIMGSFGVGTSSPATKLDVNGTLNASGAITAASGVFSTTLESHNGTNAGGVSHISMRTAAGLNRMIFGFTGDETGSNAGSNINLWRYNDAGNFLGLGWAMNRATGNMGVGQAAPASKLDVGGAIAWAFDPVFKTADFTANNDYSTYVINNGAGPGNITVTLPSASSCRGRMYFFRITAVDGTGKTVTIGTSSVRFTASADPAAGLLAIIASDGTNWVNLQGF